MIWWWQTYYGHSGTCFLWSLKILKISINFIFSFSFQYLDLFSWNFLLSFQIFHPLFFNFSIHYLYFLFNDIPSNIDHFCNINLHILSLLHFFLSLSDFLFWVCLIFCIRTSSCWNFSLNLTIALVFTNQFHIWHQFVMNSFFVGYMDWMDFR